MSNPRYILAGALALGVLASGALAQTPAQDTKPATVSQRKENQQDRIAQGVNSGQLTAGETKTLENKEAGLNAETRRMRAQDDGHLTAADRARLNRQQNRLSSQIYKDKHNAADQDYGKGRIGQRDENQQDRIAQGIKNGTLSPSEAARLERQQQNTNRAVNDMRKDDGGKLTQAQRNAVNRRQNRESRNIYRTKHDGKGR